MTKKGSFVYHGYVSSDYLDKNVRADRTQFEIPEKDDALLDTISKDKIEDRISKTHKEVS